VIPAIRKEGNDETRQTDQTRNDARAENHRQFSDAAEASGKNDG
jgi:hypothetical protein